MRDSYDLLVEQLRRADARVVKLLDDRERLEKREGTPDGQP